MFPKLTPVTKNILIICGIVYLITNFVNTQYLYQILSGYYPFSPNFKSWQIITHMFMHAPLNDSVGIMHILFNMMTLWSFGPILEQVLGSKKFTILYFVSGLGAFVVFNLWSFYEVHQLTQSLEATGVNVAEIFHKADLNYVGSFQEFLNEPDSDKTKLLKTLRSTMVGASGAIFGIVAAFATLFPDAKLMFMFIPFPIKAKYLLPIIIAVSLYLQFSGNMGGIAHLAHIGGALVGFLLARNWKNNKYRID